MSVRTIEVDVKTAASVDRLSSVQGLSASEYIADLVSRETEPAVVSAAEIAELDRRWSAIQQGEPTIDHDTVCRWLKTWGTPAFKPWPDPR